jgi:hypothetical protein
MHSSSCNCYSPKELEGSYLIILSLTLPYIVRALLLTA